jgi:hypothetical protein
LQVEENIHDPPEDGDHQDKEYPGKFVGGLFMFVKDIHGYHDADHVEGPAQVMKVHAGTGNKEKQETYLDE